MKGSQGVSARRERSFEVIDNLPGPLRECVHEFGYAIIRQCLDFGIRDPARIRQLVCVIWDGARSPADRISHGGSAALSRLDWLLMQAGAPITASALVRYLYQTNFVIVPRIPTKEMVEASINATGEMGLVSKTEKHRGRLSAAIHAGYRRMWPHLAEDGSLWKNFEPPPTLGERASKSKAA